MPLYSISNLIDKSLVFNYDTKYYLVSDINTFGKDAKPSGTFRKGSSIVVNSYLQPTSGYTSSYGIKYAPRSDYYLLTYIGGQYVGVIFSDTTFNKSALQQQGVLSVQEELEAEKNANKSIFEKLFEGIGKAGKTVLIFVLIGVIIIYIVSPVLKSKLSK